ncbi:hypothetical protein HYQ46_002365 [Verticillium longisporum]|nr:hypothetical protein HYQ46_002365 [Verticillium longisporum]
MQVGLAVEPSDRDMLWISVWLKGEFEAIVGCGELGNALPELIELPRTLPLLPVGAARFAPGCGDLLVRAAASGH